MTRLCPTVVHGYGAAMTGSFRASSKDGTRLAIFRAGVEDGPTIVAVHGYPDDHTVWDEVVHELADRHRIVSYDVRGAGASDRPRSRRAYRLDTLVDDVCAVIDVADADTPVHLLAHDWGSLQAWAALDDPRLRGRIAGFTSISGPSLAHAARWLRRARGHRRAALRQLAHSYYIVLFQLPVLPELAIRFGLFDRVIGARSRDDQRHGLQLYRANMMHLARRATGRGNVDVDIPVQVLVPTHDRFIIPDFAREAPAPFVADVTVRTFDAGHWVITEQPAAVARAVSDFVARCAADHRR